MCRSADARVSHSYASLYGYDLDEDCHRIVIGLKDGGRSSSVPRMPPGAVDVPLAVGPGRIYVRRKVQTYYNSLVRILDLAMVVVICLEHIYTVSFPACEHGYQ